MHHLGATQLQRQPRSPGAPRCPSSAQTWDSDSRREGGHSIQEAVAGLHRHPEGRLPGLGVTTKSSATAHRNPPQPNAAFLSPCPILQAQPGRTGLDRNAGLLLRQQGSCPGRKAWTATRQPRPTASPHSPWRLRGPTSSSAYSAGAARRQVTEPPSPALTSPAPGW